MLLKQIKIVAGSIFFLCLIGYANNSVAEDNKPLPVVVVPQRLPGAETEGYVGVDKCADCHMEQFKKWQKTRHAQAFFKLYKERQQPKADCLRCHTTGYGELGGFNNPADSAHLAGVQCEACHGGGSRHLKDVKQLGWDAITDCVDCRIRKVCMPCHTPKHSPNFDFESYLAKVRCESD